LLLPVVAVVISSVLVIPLYLYLVHNGVLSGLGGDRGDALDVGLRRLLDGEYPYSELTSWGGKITPLPGGLILALPGHALGGAGLATAYLVPISVWVLWRVNPVLASVSSLALVLSPAFWADALSSGDLVVTAFLLFAVGAALLNNLDSGAIQRTGWALTIGVAAATRITSVIALLMVVAVGISLNYTRRALETGAIAVLVIAALSLPFYLWNPEEFSPLHTSSFTQGPIGLGIALSLAAIAWLVVARGTALAGATASARLVWALAPLSIALTATPFLLGPSYTTLYLTGYGVFAVVAPVVLLDKRFNSDVQVSRALSEPSLSRLR